MLIAGLPIHLFGTNRGAWIAKFASTGDFPSAFTASLGRSVGSDPATDAISMLCGLIAEANKAISSKLTRKSLTSGASSMEPKKRRKTKGTVIIGRGASTVRIYPITRKDGYLQNTLCWKEGGRRRTRCFACMDEAKMVAQQISVRLVNGWSLGDEVTRRGSDLRAIARSSPDHHAV